MCGIISVSKVREERKMSWKEWKHDLDEANKAYDSGRIEMAEGIAKAHGYDMEKLLEEH